MYIPGEKHLACLSRDLPLSGVLVSKPFLLAKPTAVIRELPSDDILAVGDLIKREQTSKIQRTDE